MTNNTHITANVEQAVPFFMVMNMEKSLAFYMNGLGFDLKTKWEPGGTIEWCWLETGSAAIMLQAYREDFVPTDTRGVGLSVCFMCKDALQIYKEAVSRGLSPREPFVGNSLWVVEFKDPDNYSILFESPTDVPEETMYSDWTGKA